MMNCDGHFAFSRRSRAVENFVPWVAVLILLFVVTAPLVWAQGKQSQGTGSSGSGSSSSASSGISFPRDTWLSLKQMPTRTDGDYGGFTVLCYRLTTLDSASVPYRIIPYPVDSKQDAQPALMDESGKKIPCEAIDLAHPLTMDTKLVIALDLGMFPGDHNRLVDTGRIAEMVLNVQTSAGSPLSPNPTRTYANQGTMVNLGGGAPAVLYLPWPYELPGDSVPTVSLSVLYSPPKPGDHWQPDTFYPPGTVVAPKTGSTDYFMTDHGGQSGDKEPKWASANWQDISDSSCLWTAIAGGGATLPQQFQNKQKLWLPNSTYSSGDIIQGPGSNQLFIMNKKNSALGAMQMCTTGANWDPSWNIAALKGGHPQPQDSDCNWSWTADNSSGLPQGNQSRVKLWIAGGEYNSGDLIQAPGSQIIFTMNKLNSATQAVQVCTSGASWDPKSNDAKPVTDGLLSVTEYPVLIEQNPGGVHWQLEPRKSTPCTPADVWKSKTPYASLQAVCEGTNSWYLVAQAGMSGESRPDFNAAKGLTWELSPAQCGAGPGWAANTSYKAAGTICVDGDLYETSADGTSGNLNPFGGASSVTRQLTWHDVGPVPPSTVTGTLAADQNISALPTITLPQSHTRYSYNVAAGVLVTNLRTKTFGFSGTTNSGKPVQTGSTLLVDPVISLTKYFKAFDAERKWRVQDLTPGLTLSFSLTSPSNNFYIGGSSELLRYIQLEYGLVAARLPQPVQNVFVGNGTTPTTTTTFHAGAYIGLSFNFTGLISAATGGGSSSKGGGSGSSGSSTSGN